MDRRQFLQASILAAGGATVAGWATSNRGNANQSFPEYDIPAYSAWPPAEPRTNDFVLFTHLNITHLHRPDEDLAETPEADEDEDDPLLSMSVYGFVVTALWFELGLLAYPWQGTLGEENEPEGMDTDALTMTESTFVCHGEYDPDMFVDEYSDGFDVSENDGFTVFEGQADEREGAAYAVSDDTVVAALGNDTTDAYDDEVAVLHDGVDNRVTEANRIVDDADGAWLYETTGPADVVTGMWQVEGLEEADLQLGDEDDEDAAARTPIEDNPVFANVKSFINTSALPDADGGVGGDAAAARFAALYPEGKVPSEEELREGLLADDSDLEVEITTSADRAHVAAEGKGGDLEETTPHG